MPQNFIYDPSTIHKKGTDYKIAIARVNSDTTPKSGEYFFNLAATEKVSRKHDTGVDEFKNMHGDIVQTDNGDVKGELKFTLMQDDAITENFLMEETSDAYFVMILHKGAGAVGKQEFVYYPKIRISTSFSEDIPGRNAEMTATPLSAPQAWNANSLTATQNSTTGWLFGTQATSTIQTLSGALTGSAGSYSKAASLTIA